ncbi:cyd operon YbgE family protein [Lysobacter sp. BMK333-48F3]|uniref:cyd operon YbgE family protein n=1 Tax=Lysobacter sp. BMK333-48F3 TaxID=2867962 RepID=UPI001C8C2154|nr:cyd operon YbgE family protein [Lysobacter sp. BMK333-48F3]MBX9402881.1 cyd operon YbgE family protein [Lysobacter sp. BMK333-48F3]
MARAVSLLLASALSLALLFLPAMRGGEMTAAGHGLLSPLMLLICASFVHGVGLRPRHALGRAALHPAWLWPAMLGMAALWAARF